MQSACGVFIAIWPVWLYHNFPHYLLIGAISDKCVFNVICVFWLFLEPSSETILILRRIQRNIITNVTYMLFSPNFYRTWIFSKDFRKELKYQISWNSIQWEPSCSCWQTDGHDEANLQFNKCSSSNNRTLHNVIGGQYLSLCPFIVYWR